MKSIVRMRWIASVGGAVLLGVVLNLTAVGAVGNSEQRAPKGGPAVFVDYRGQPQSWKEAVDTADLIAVVRPLARSYPQVREKDDPQTIFRARVVEVIGGPRASSVGREIDIARYGGIIQHKGQAVFVEHAGFPAWEIGKTSLVFLDWSEVDQAFVLPFGPDSSFELDASTNKVQSYGRGRLAVTKKGKSFDEVLAEVKASIK